MSKVEFAAGYARMQGKRTLFPLGFHCTGMAIKACADKLVREIGMFGRNFEGCKDEDLAVDNKPEPDTTSIQPPPKEVGTKFVGSKSKDAAKTIKAK